MPMLEVRDLSVEFRTFEGIGRAVSGVDLTVNERQIVGVVGESGSGKSAIAAAIMNLVSRPGKVVSGSVMYGGQDLLRTPERVMQQIRGRQIALITQNARSE